jgi:hypothetical protein
MHPAIRYPQIYPQTTKENAMSDPIILPNINYGTFKPQTGFFTAHMLCAALGLTPAGTNQIATAVNYGLLPQPDFKSDGNPITWLWYSATVQSYMTASAAASLQASVASYYQKGLGAL